MVPPKKIISCSLEGIKQHQKFGYKKNIFHYIPNGISFSHDSISDHLFSGTENLLFYNYIYIFLITDTKHIGY